jgi:hypothetical protein
MSEQSESIGNLVKALVEVQGSIKSAKKEAVNPFFHSKYADLGAVWESCRALLKANGLVVIQTTKIIVANTTVEANIEAGIALVSTLAHTSGEWIKGELLLIPVKRDPQGIGSAISYARRYALAALLGIVSDEDDDGNAASTPPQTQSFVKSNPRPLPDVVKDAHTNVEAADLLTSRFLAPEMFTSKTGKGYWRTMDSEGAKLFIFDEKIASAISAKAEKEITVEIEKSEKGTRIVGVIS